MGWIVLIAIGLMIGIPFLRFIEMYLACGDCLEMHDENEPCVVAKTKCECTH